MRAFSLETCRWLVRKYSGGHWLNFQQFANVLMYAADAFDKFKQMDLNQSDSLTVQEVGRLMTLSGLQLPQAAVDAMVTHFDMTRMHEITFDAFLLLKMKCELFYAGFGTKADATGRATLTFSDFLTLVFLVPEVDKDS